MIDQRLRGLVFEGGRVRPLPVEQAPRVEPLAGADQATRALRRAARLVEHGRAFDALPLLVAAIRSAPRSPHAYHLLARALRYRRRAEQAEAAYRTALDLDPGRLDSRHELASLLQAERRIDEAHAEWLATLERQPDHGPAHARLAALHFLLGDESACEAHRLAAVRLRARLPSALAASCAPRTVSTASSSGVAQSGALPPTRVDVGSGAAHSAEPILAVSGGSTMVASWIDLRTGGNSGVWKVGAAVSLNGGLSWTDQVLSGPGSTAGHYEGDPMTAHDPRTGNLWVGGIHFGYATGEQGKLWLARHQPGTTSFQAPVLIHAANFIDKGLLAAGPRPSLPATTRLYVVYNLGIQRSDDLGATWSAVQALPSGLGYQPRVGPGGVLYVVYWDFAFGVVMVKSTDGGVTFGAPITVATRLDTWGPEENNPIFPGEFRVAPLPYLAVHPSTGALTVVYPDTTAVAGSEADVNLYVTRSTDGGVTWTTPAVLNGDSTPPRDQFHPWIEADSTGRLHLAFFDTRSTPQVDADSNAKVDVFYATSANGGASWAEQRVTAQPFESALAPFSSFTHQFLGDYISLATVGDPHNGGRVHLLYPSTVDGHLHVYAQQVVDGLLFADGFESGNTSGWSAAAP